MKKALLRVLLVICGLSVFTSCYGMPPGEWEENDTLPEEQDQTKASVTSAVYSDLEEESMVDPSDPDQVNGAFVPVED